MNLEELEKIESEDESPSEIKSIDEKFGKPVINGKIAIPVDIIASYFETNLDISVFDETGIEIGVLCFTKEIGETNWRELTENQFIAFLNEAEYLTREDDYIFTNNYLILNEDKYEHYVENHKETSPIWGGFCHRLLSPMESYKKGITRIDISSLNLRNNLFKESAIRAVIQPFAFERFLKLYHLLELRFDSEVIEEIQGLDLDLEPEKIGKILNSYSYKEIERLTHVIEENCLDISRITDKLNNVANYESLAIQIFYKFGKPTNPIKEETHFINLLGSGFEERYLTKSPVNYSGNNYPKFIKKLATYWIYRIRCSIAHNRIGEYILSHNEEDFIVEFAEPLLKEIVIQCFKR